MPHNEEHVRIREHVLAGKAAAKAARDDAWDRAMQRQAEVRVRGDRITDPALLAARAAEAAPEPVAVEADPVEAAPPVENDGPAFADESPDEDASPAAEVAPAPEPPKGRSRR